MSPILFKELVEKYDMEIVSQEPIKFNALNNWNGTDFISFFIKP
jgi:hypothetical protein